MFRLPRVLVDATDFLRDWWLAEAIVLVYTDFYSSGKESSDIGEVMRCGICGCGKKSETLNGVVCLMVQNKHVNRVFVFFF